MSSIIFGGIRFWDDCSQMYQYRVDKVAEISIALKSFFILLLESNFDDFFNKTK